MTEVKSDHALVLKSAWEQFHDDQIKASFEFAEGYKQFLSEVKTEREATNFIKQFMKDPQKKIFINKNKEIAIVQKGLKSLNEGVHIVIAHIDSPRLDLKQKPLYEDADSHLALFETHYYGGIKKFHWVTIPLSIHGVIILRNGNKIELALGEEADDPIFAVPDLLPHLSHDIQDTKKMKEAIKGESLDIVVGGLPIMEDSKEKIKAAILDRLHKDYDLVEEDFISAELEAVPAFPPRDLGFDRSMVAGYGQDDRISAYTTLKAIADISHPIENTALAIFVDKEEIGSEGNTAAQVTTFLRSILHTLDPNADIDQIMLNSKVISADVNAAVTPNYSDEFELRNACFLGYGVVMSKYTGHGGKYSAHDATAEYVAEIRTLLNQKKIPWQTGELGKVDKGGGGTVAKYFSRLGMEVIDLGAPVLSMHSPYEITSKADIYASYLAYHAFLSGYKLE